MKKTGVKFTGLAAGALLYAFAAPALAEEDGTSPANNAPPAPAPAPTATDTTAPAPTTTPAKSDKEAAATTVPTWESYGGGSTESVIAPGTLPMNPMTHLTPLRFVSTPGLWVGFALTAVFLATAVRLRRNQEPT